MTALISAAAAAIPKLTRNAATTRGSSNVAIAAAKPIPAALTTRAASGISTISAR